MTQTHKHATSSVHLFSADNDRPQIGLILHPRLNKWMLPGGHVEPHENEAEAALREVLEETGNVATLIKPNPPNLAGLSSGVPLPLIIVEQQVPSDSTFSGAHTHVDHIYVAIATRKTQDPELPFEWYDADALAALDMFDETRQTAMHLFKSLLNPAEWSRMVVKAG
jgi:8-oxo-dGTP pyrophosphatase MutT (NUDIX family)